MEEFFRDYKIDSVIGNGAFGQVYRIVREEFGHTYEAALKVIELPKDPSEVEAMRREGMSKQNVTEYYQSVVEDIVREFELMSKLKGNSYIVSYEDHKVIEKKDEFGWKIYIQMELLTPLLIHMETKGTSYHDVLHMGIDICKAMELCQKYKIIHRDIKPENIFVSSNGTFKLGDFGIARQLDQTNGNLSQKGTRNYMAPEIFRGREYDSTVDIYSLGIVLYRLFNDNRMPFMPLAPLPIRFSDKENAMTKRLSGETMPKPLHASEKLAQIILKACAFHPSDRYREPKQLREALEEVLREEENQVLFEPIKEEFGEKCTSDVEKRQDDEQKTVLLRDSNEQKDVLMQSTEMLQEDKMVVISMAPQRKRHKFKFIVGGLVVASVLVLIIGVTSFLQHGKQRDASMIEMVTEKPTPELTEEPVVTLKATEKMEINVKPHVKSSVKSTAKPVTEKPKSATEKPKPVTEMPKKTTAVPKKAENGNSQEVINVKPEEQQEIVIK